MVYRSRRSKRRESAKRRSKGNVFKLSPFPKPLARPRPWAAVKRETRSRHKVHSSRMCRVNIKHRQFIEQPKRRAVRIRRTIDQSIQSHIDRLSQHRYNSMLKTSTSNCCPAGLCSYSNYSESTVSSKPKTTYGISRNKSTVMPTHKVASELLKAKKTSKQKEDKIQEIRTNDFESYSHDSTILDDDIKHITESVKHFEKQRLAFLSSLAHIHAQVSSLRIPPASMLKETAESEMKKNPFWRLRQEEQQGAAKEISTQQNNATSTAIIMTSTKSEQMRKPPKHKKKPIVQPGTSPKLKNLNSNIMDNLSKLLMNTAQRPTNKVKSEVSMNKLPTTMQNNLDLKGLSRTLQGGGGLMNLAQSLCSAMTNAF